MKLEKIEHDCMDRIIDALYYTINWAETNKRIGIIHRETGITRGNIFGHQTGKYETMNMKFANVKKMLDFYIDFLQDERLRAENNDDGKKD